MNSRIIQSSDKILTIIASSEMASKAKLQRMATKGAVVIVLGKSKVDLKRLLSVLKDIGINKLLVEGGGEINWSMLTNDLVDEVIVTIAPRIVGGRKAVTLVEGQGFAKVINGIKLKLYKVSKNDSEVVLFYRVL